MLLATGAGVAGDELGRLTTGVDTAAEELAAAGVLTAAAPTGVLTEAGALGTAVALLRAGQLVTVGAHEVMVTSSVM